MMAMAGVVGLAGPSVFACQAPLTVSVTASAASVEAAMTITLDAIAVNPGGRTPHSVAYAWSTDGGTIRGFGPEVVYRAPDVPGTYTITVTAATGFGRSRDTATATLTETVTPQIASVEFIGSLSNPTITITGLGFGSEPAPSGLGYAGFTGYDYGDQLWFQDLSSDPYAWNAGEQGNYIGLNISTYTDTNIAYQFGSNYPLFYYPEDIYALHLGDTFVVHVLDASCTGTVSLDTPISCN
jgi:hypothetical protein